MFRSRFLSFGNSLSNFCTYLYFADALLLHCLINIYRAVKLDFVVAGALPQLRYDYNITFTWSNQSPLCVNLS
ncbi:hypothetical protein ACOSQ3_030353 [Xanthoceras sorbifolium]